MPERRNSTAKDDKNSTGQVQKLSGQVVAAVLDGLWEKETHKRTARVTVECVGNIFAHVEQKDRKLPSPTPP